MAAFLRRLQQKRHNKRGREKKQAQPEAKAQESTNEIGDWRVLDTRQIPSEVGNERLAMSYVAEAVKNVPLSERRKDQLGTAVAEATMNAMEHGNHYNPEMPVTLQILSSDDAIAVRISDQGDNGSLPGATPYEAPDIEAKLAELQSPRGWGLFLIQNMVDEMHVLNDEHTHTIELIVRLEGGQHTHQHASG